MRAIILSAGVGRRLGDAHHGPKSLLAFGGRTLLAHHLECLADLGVGHVALCVGHEAGMLREAVAASPHAKLISTVLNPDYREGSVVSLWAMRHYLRPGGDVILMDADVLYHPVLLERLVSTNKPNCFLLDRDFEPGEEPVKLCVRDGRLVEFRKRITADLEYDFVGESVGFFRFEERTAGRLARMTEDYVNGGRRQEPYEEAIRDLLLATPGVFGFEDVTGLPWVEIDFPEDIARADREILPQLNADT
ncbi:MAG: phosphocholine cytidylyltransferase family protein [Chromatiales bacterium]